MHGSIWEVGPAESALGNGDYGPLCKQIFTCLVLGNASFNPVP